MHLVLVGKGPSLESLRRNPTRGQPIEQAAKQAWKKYKRTKDLVQEEAKPRLSKVTAAHTQHLSSSNSSSLWLERPSLPRPSLQFRNHTS